MVEGIGEKNDIESLQVEKFCETMEELINSEDFERAFEIVMKHNKKYDKDYFLGILGKIRKKDNLTTAEKEDIVNLLEDEKVNKIAEKVYNKLKGFTIEETKQFLEKYPVSSMIDSLKRKTKGEFIATLDKKYELEKQIEVGGQKFLWIVETDDDGNKKYGVIKYGEEEKKIEEKLVFDGIYEIKESNGEVYICGIRNGKLGFVKYGEETNIDKYLIDFDPRRISRLGKDEKGMYYEYRGKMYLFSLPVRKYVNGETGNEVVFTFEMSI